MHNDSNEIDEKVEAWHKSDTSLSLREWLEMSEEEFADWVAGKYFYVVHHIF